MKNLLKALLLAALFSSGTAIPGLAASATWSSTSNGTWATITNWSTGAAPGNSTGSFTSDIATFDTSTGVVVTVDSKRGISQVNFDGNVGSFAFSSGSLYVASGGAININSDVSSTGQTETFNNIITAVGSLSINNNATTGVAFNFSSTSTIINTKASGTAIVSLGGTNTAANTVNSVIKDGATATTQLNIGGGTWILGGTNTYTGSTTVGGGKLLIAANGAIAASSLNLSGGALGFNATGIAAVTTGTLNVGVIGSILDFGSGFSNSLSFANSSGVTWNGSLSIYNWNASDTLSFGVDTTGLTGAQLSKITFYSDAGSTSLGAAVFSGVGGDLTFAAAPEPSSIVLAAAGAVGLLLVFRRRALA